MKPKPVEDAAAADRAMRSFGVQHVARALSLHPETVRDFLRTRRIAGFRVGNRWRVRQDVLDDLLTCGVPLACDWQS
jgi:excisionase family DNA binding protein